MKVASEYLDSILLLIITIPIFVPIKINVGILFMLLWVLQFLCLLIAFKMRIGITQTIKELLKGHIERIFDNNILSIPIIANAVYVAAFFLTMFQESHGIPTGSPEVGNLYEFYFISTYAAVFEELTFRILIIGLYEAAINLGWGIAKNLLKSSRDKFNILWKSILFPHKAREALGIGNDGLLGLNNKEWIIISFSSVMFGLAHILSGSGWQIGKLSQATLTGLAMGIIYLKFGFQAPLILHWFFNNYLQVYSIIYDKLPAIGDLLNLLDPLNFIVGVSFWSVMISVKLYKLLHSKFKISSSKRNSVIT